MAIFIEKSTLWEWLKSGRAESLQVVQRARTDIDALQEMAALLEHYFIKYTGYDLQFAKVQLDGGEIGVVFGYLEKDGASFYPCI